MFESPLDTNHGRKTKTITNRITPAGTGSLMHTMEAFFSISLCQSSVRQCSDTRISLEQAQMMMCKGDRWEGLGQPGIP